jgi:hypothetical protein
LKPKIFALAWLLPLRKWIIRFFGQRRCKVFGRCPIASWSSA